MNLTSSRTARRLPWLWLSLTMAALALGLVHLGVIAGDTLPPGTFAGSCASWQPVNDPAFGMPSNFNSDGNPISTTIPFNGEEGFEAVVFDGQLYVGMEADNKFGARLWRTKAGVFIPVAQADWEEVAADAQDQPFGNTVIAQNDHIDSLAVFNGALYASTANRSGYALGTRVYSSATGAPNSWTSVITDGFGDVNNTNFKDMVVFNVAGADRLCGGTSNDSTGAQVWCTEDGATWTKVNSDGFGDPGNSLVASTGVFSGALYVGMVNDAGGNVWRTTNLVTWTQVFTAFMGARVEIVGSLGDYFYVASGARDGMTSTNPYLYIRLYRSASGDAGTWSQVGTNIGPNDVYNTRTIVDGAVTYNGALYVSTMNANTGVELWRTTGETTWTQVNVDGFGDAGTFAAQMITFNGYLYAWTSNYTDGQRVLRSACPIVQPQTVGGPGRVDFPGVGAVFTMTGGAAEAITVSVLPGALPTAQKTQRPVARTYHLAVAPATATFTGDLTLSYLPEELAVAQAASNTLYLTRWDGAQWVDCPVAQRARDVATRRVTCRGVSDFSTWVIAGEGGAPTAVTVVLRSVSRGGRLQMLAGVGVMMAVGLALWIPHQLRCRRMP
ncbi:MAG: hypothetical protein JXA21_13075 [Anaerolineae bacterium]|nr:hypothetical protein [Anaerolineae bacterium]